MTARPLRSLLPGTLRHAVRRHPAGFSTLDPEHIAPTMLAVASEATP